VPEELGLRGDLRLVHNRDESTACRLFGHPQSDEEYHPVSVLHIRHIEKALNDQFAAKIDISDLQDRPEGEQRCSFLSRALAACVVQSRSTLTSDEAADSIIDAFHDNGIDAIAIDPASISLTLVQAKWSEKGNKTIDLGDMHKFLAGVRDLLHGRYSRFNDKAQPILDRVSDILDRVGCRVEILVVHTSSQTIGEEPQRAANDLLEELNDISEIARFEAIGQRGVYDIVSSSFEGDPVCIDVTLLDWGRLEEPYRAFYGQVTGEAVGAWWGQYRDRIFAKNIRQFLPDSTINSTIQETFRGSPDEFWYMNNGITLLCEKIEKKILGGVDRSVGYFRCQGVSIINGAQTVGAIGRAQADSPERPSKSRILARFISLEDCPNDFGKRVTVATNTQNRIQARDFASLDPEQERLRKELQFDDVEYVYRSGVRLPSPESGCTIVDATIALACASSDLRLTVAAKASLGSLWETERPSYKMLFNGSVTGPHLWWAVKVYYIVEGVLRTLRNKSDGSRVCAYAGNRFVLRQVFQVLTCVEPKHLDDVNIAGIIHRVVELMIGALEDVAIYPAQLFKNADLCAKFEHEIDAAAEVQADFSDGAFEFQFRQAARTHPNFRAQELLFPDDEVLA